MLRKMVSEFIHRQMVDCSNVKAQQRYASGKFFFVSCAGMITYKCKSDADVSRFRNKWASRFEEIRMLPLDEQKPEFFRLFKEIRSEEKIKFSANVRTRACYFNPLI